MKYCADATLREVPNAGHWLLHEEAALTSGELSAFFQPGAVATAPSP
jgi:hypothetical protein